MSKSAHWVATTFGLGDILPAPGTFAGSLPTACLWFCLAWSLGQSPWLFIWTTIAMIASVVAGIWAAEVEIERRSNKDPGPVVIDEVAGQLLTYLCALPLWSFRGPADAAMMAGAGFVLFRIFDILKPWPIGRLERFKGGLGVMADDLGAGVAAGILLGLGNPFFLRLLEKIQ